MFEIKEINAENKKELYTRINVYLKGLICEDSDWLAGISNACALLNLTLPDINWVGFLPLERKMNLFWAFSGETCMYQDRAW